MGRRKTFSFFCIHCGCKTEIPRKSLIYLVSHHGGYDNIFEIGGDWDRFENPLNPCKPLLFLDLQFLRHSGGEIVS